MVPHKTDEGNFDLSVIAQLPIVLVEFGENVLFQVFQVDSQGTGGRYDTVIRSDIMINIIGINLL